MAAYTQSKRLCALLAEREDDVWLFAELLTVADVRHMAQILPEAEFDYADVRTGPMGERIWFELDVTTMDDAALQPHLPLAILEEVPARNVEERFVAAVRQGMAAIEWHGLWPDDAEADQYGAAKYDGVQLVFHGDRAQLAGWTERHTVWGARDGDGPAPGRLRRWQ
ncbi:hypothetical protein ACQF36_37140 [Streptomyces sp. Marseille-Q5077]|uniref:hypothetical protein n=1 Tax=Streptomyces sp. Marseille-Q5077 TaxID=3418995 RepID=UPI003D0455E9